MFDQTNLFQEHTTESAGVPIRYTSNGTSMGYCYDEVMFTTGQILYSFSQMFAQKSCKPNTGNAGNYYSWATVTGGGKSQNSLCPKSWRLPKSGAENGFRNLMITTYNAKNNSQVLILPFSYVLSGRYQSSNPNTRGGRGRYYSNTKESQLFIGGGYFVMNSGDEWSDSNGLTVRCVAR